MATTIYYYLECEISELHESRAVSGGKSNSSNPESSKGARIAKRNYERMIEKMNFVAASTRVKTTSLIQSVPAPE